jgi:flagellar hook-length control protein FliK
VPAPAGASDTPGQLRPDAPEAEKAGDLPVSKVAVNPNASQGAAHPSVPLVAATRSEALAPVDTPPSAPAVPGSVPEQIVSAVVPLHGRGDGRHEVTLELRPDDLGIIRVEVTVEQQTVHLTLHAAEPATGRLLSAALHELRTALTDAGLTAGQLGVGVDGGGGAGQRRTFADHGDADLHRSGRPGRRGAAITDEPPPVRPLRPAAAGRLDLFL